MSVFQRILVAYDGSDDSQAALELAISLTRDQGATLTLLSVVPDVPVAVTSITTGAYDVGSVYAEMQQSARASIPDDVPVTVLLRHGSPAHAIATAAADHDLVVMGTHGRGRIGEALAGSVSRAVVHSLHAPVLITRAPAGADDTSAS